MIEVKEAINIVEPVLNLGQCHDFTEPTVKAIIKAATETETSQWYKTSDWACWGDVKKEIEYLDWDDCANYNDNYYVELSNENKRFLEKYTNVVKTVYGIDSSTSFKVTGPTAMVSAINSDFGRISDSITIVD